MLTINALSKSFSPDILLLDRLSLTVKAGESVSIQGASGCGKSTLLSLIAGFDAPDEGQIYVGNERIFDSHVTASTKASIKGPATTGKLDDFRKQHLGIVFQSYNLFDCFNAYDNIAFTSRLKGNFDAKYQQHLMQELGIAHLAKKPIHLLSGGEQQRCAIARALVHRPALVLADEPTGNLDEATSDIVSTLLFDVCRSTNTALVVVTHSEEVAAKAVMKTKLHGGKLVSLANDQSACG